MTPDSEKIFLNLKEIMAVLLKVDIGEINAIANTNSALRDDLGIDSVEGLDFLTAIESSYSIHISDHDAAKLKTVSDVIDLIFSKKYSEQ